MNTIDNMIKYKRSAFTGELLQKLCDPFGCKMKSVDLHKKNWHHALCIKGDRFNIAESYILPHFISLNNVGMYYYIH